MTGRRGCRTEVLLPQIPRNCAICSGSFTYGFPRSWQDTVAIDGGVIFRKDGRPALMVVAAPVVLIVRAGDAFIHLISALC